MMGQPYLVFGCSGSGKTTVGATLASRGYKVVDTDKVLARYEDSTSGHIYELSEAKHLKKQYGELFYKRFRLIWPLDLFNGLVEANDGAVVFCGSGSSVADYIPRSRVAFALIASGEVLTERLTTRDPARFYPGAYLLERAVNASKRYKKMFPQSKFPNLVYVDAEAKVDHIANEIEKYILRDMTVENNHSGDEVHDT